MSRIVEPAEWVSHPVITKPSWDTRLCIDPSCLNRLCAASTTRPRLWTRWLRVWVTLKARFPLSPSPVETGPSPSPPVLEAVFTPSCQVEYGSPWNGLSGGNCCDKNGAYNSFCAQCSSLSIAVFICSLQLHGCTQCFENINLAGLLPWNLVIAFLKDIRAKYRYGYWTRWRGRAVQNHFLNNSYNFWYMRWSFLPWWLNIYARKWSITWQWMYIYIKIAKKIGASFRYYNIVRFKHFFIYIFWKLSNQTSHAPFGWLVFPK